MARSETIIFFGTCHLFIVGFYLDYALTLEAFVFAWILVTNRT